MTSAHITRRNFLRKAGMSAAATFFPATFLGEAEGIVPRMIREAEASQISIQKLRRNISVLDGAGGNIAVLTGNDGKVLVDAGFSVSRPRVSQALASIDAMPLRHLINSHWHFDHTDGNEWLHAEGAQIIAHQRTLDHLSVATRVDGWDFTFPRKPAGALPTVTFGERHVLHLNNTELILSKYPPAHTDSDISIRYVQANVLHVADTWWNGFYPFIDYSTGGSIDGTITAAEMNVAATDRDTIVVPGHGPVSDRAGLVEYERMLVTIRHNVTLLKRRGMTVEDVVAAQPTARFDAKYGNFLMSPQAFTRLVYQGT